MSDLMRPIPFGHLLARMFEELEREGTLFGLADHQIYRKTGSGLIRCAGGASETAIGPAAGPHTQLAQNIVASYLAGGRFIELKTVQILDALDIEKPCIDARDEGFNTEWSSELTLEQSWQEYAKAWILLHLLQALLTDSPSVSPRFQFTMSVGYDLEGITSPRMDQFISRMTDSSNEPLFRGWVDQAVSTLAGRLPEALGLGSRTARAVEAMKSLSPAICSSVTLSTMHGCPPEEIEAICGYTLRQKRLHTWVKLNPTLLGFDAVGSVLDRLGYGYIELDRDGFEHDLQYDDATGILRRLKSLGSRLGLLFGVKLTNTLGARNNVGLLPGDEMYMSGRALFPLSIRLAARLAREFSGDLDVSFSGGITVHTVRQVFAAGIRPITVATDLLKPGGYSRLTQMAGALDRMPVRDGPGVDVAALEALADEAERSEYSRKEFRGLDRVSVPGGLPLLDCAVAPCVSACAIGQPIPDYVRLVGERRYAEALALIYERNPLPSITGHICDHLCQLNCTRLDYEGEVQIREMKKLAAENGFREFQRSFATPGQTRSTRVAVIGAGPAGLSAAYFLAREGFPVTVFEREASAGGVVAHVVPHFRVKREILEADIAFIRSFGVEFVFSCDPEFTVDALKDQGYACVCVSIGTYSPRPTPLGAGDSRVHSSTPFLQRFNSDPFQVRIGRRVGVVGGGDTAMDTARAALRCHGVEEVSLFYRRDRSQMPARAEEYELARRDGVVFHFLRDPFEFSPDGTLLCRVMELGAPDASGRCSPVRTDAVDAFRLDSLIYAIGDGPDTSLLARAGIPVGSGVTPFELETPVSGVYLLGDSRTGPSSIVRCISEGRRAADAICLREDPAWSRAEPVPVHDRRVMVRRIAAKKGVILSPVAAPHPESDVREPRSRMEARARTEASRCLECNLVCNKCVEVCPNRANIAVSAPAGQPGDHYQIVHLDALCNECGNCTDFCPWEGRPYTDKPTVFSRLDDFRSSSNPGWVVEGERLHYRYHGDEGSVHLDKVAARYAAGDDADRARFFGLFARLYATRPSLFAAIDQE